MLYQNVHSEVNGFCYATIADDAGGGNQRWQADAGQAKSFEEELAAKLKARSPC